MKSVKIAILAGSLSLLAWSQGMPQSNAGGSTQPAQQPAAQANAAAQGAGSASTISGCMQDSWGRFIISNGATTYDVKGIGTSLSDHVNHMVQVRGLPDTKSAQGNVTPIYALQVQDSGQGCGPNAGMNAQNTAQPGATTGATSTAQPMAGAQQSQNPSMATPQAGASQSGTAPQISGETPAAQVATQPGGSTESAVQPNADMEAKGAPAAGTPSSAVAAPAGSAAPAPESESTAASSAQQPSLSTFTGCLSGKDNQYEFKANGKSYRLQGNTTMLHGMAGHDVEISGEDFNGKAIQVNGARDLGSSCSKK